MGISYVRAENVPVVRDPSSLLAEEFPPSLLVLVFPLEPLQNLLPVVLLEMADHAELSLQLRE